MGDLYHPGNISNGPYYIIQGLCFDDKNQALSFVEKELGNQSQASEYLKLLEQETFKRLKGEQNMNFTIYVVSEASEKEYGPKIGDVRVRFEETGDDHCTEMDENGQRYFAIPNIINPKWQECIMGTLFVGRIKDAYESIVRGHGDVIGTTQMFGPLGFQTESVYRYVDREYGEALRMKTLEGWKDTIFGYNVSFGYNNSMSGPNPVMKDDTLYSPLAQDKRELIRFFEDEEAAQLYIDAKMAIAKPLSEEYDTLTTSEQKQKFLKEKFTTRESHHNIIWHLFYAMNKTDSDEDRSFSFESRQAVKCT